MARTGQKEKLSEKDKNFSKDAAMGGMAEVELGKLAQQNAQNDEVKQFGTRMVQDHTNANQQLMAILANTDVSVRSSLMRRIARRSTGCQRCGVQIDRAYMHDMVQDHEKDVKKFRAGGRTRQRSEIKSFAQNTLPVLEQHLEMAHDTSKSLTAVGSSGGAQGNRDR